MQLLQWPPKMIASEAWEKGKIILIGWFCFLQRQPFQLEGWDQLEGSPFTMLVGGSKTSLGLVPVACSVHMHLHASICSASVGTYLALGCMLGVCTVCGWPGKHCAGSLGPRWALFSPLFSGKWVLALQAQMVGSSTWAVVTWPTSLSCWPYS